MTYYLARYFYVFYEENIQPGTQTHSSGVGSCSELITFKEQWSQEWKPKKWNGCNCWMCYWLEKRISKKDHNFGNQNMKNRSYWLICKKVQSFLTCFKVPGGKIGL